MVKKDFIQMNYSFRYKVFIFLPDDALTKQKQTAFVVERSPFLFTPPFVAEIEIGHGG